jgi:hypothetical protein
MAISHLTEAMSRFREGKGERPGPNFRPHISAVLKFCRRENGGKQKDSIVGALERLASTLITIEHTDIPAGYGGEGAGCAHGSS